jgi:predicted deacetylase
MTAKARLRSAQYLLRFDDLCPTGDKEKWQRYLPMLQRYGIRPIVAVIPDNRDPDFEFGPPDQEFWKHMRTLEGAGAVIGLHGYQHLCHGWGRSVVAIHRQTEFAGVPEEWQRKWVHDGMAILRGHGLRPRVWVAPRHGFDEVTLSVLREEQLEIVSDGFASRPYRLDGLTWLPQQLWGPVAQERGLWTICIHPYTASDESVVELERFLGRFAAQFSSVDRVLEEWPIRERALADRIFYARMLTRIKLSQTGRKLRLW